MEGINGCGKSSIINELKIHFDHMRQPVRVYKFPDRTGKFGKQLDDHLCKKEVFKYKYDLLAAFAGNQLAVKNNIIQDIMDGYIVICDRYYFSGIVYQTPLDASKRTIKHYNNVVGHFYKKMPSPDFTYLINGDHLHLRKETPQRYHYKPDANQQLFEIFKEIIVFNTNKYTILKNEYGKLDATAQYIINDINTYRRT